MTLSREKLAAEAALTGYRPEFLERLMTTGDIVPGLITKDAALADAIKAHPALLWKAEAVREFAAGKRRQSPKKRD